MTSKTRIAQIGFGYWGPNILRAISSHGDAEIVAVSDNDQEQLAKAGRQFPTAALCTDIDDVIARNDVDAIIVALPAGLHFDVTKKALEAGKHCFVEKPLALTTSDCKTLLGLAARKNVVLMVGHTFEYHGAVRKIKALIDAGEVGEIYSIIAQRMNLRRIRQDVDAMWNLAPHDFSIALYWLNQAMPVSIRAQGFSHLPRPKPLADLTYLTMEFASGAVVHIISSWLSPEKIRKVMLVGSKKMVTYDDVDVESMVQIHDKGVDLSSVVTTDYGEYQTLVRSGDLVIPALRITEPLRIEMYDFVDCIRQGKTPVADGQSGLRVTRILEAASESMARNGAPIKFE
jgi:predicted dehydrogenase